MQTVDMEIDGPATGRPVGEPNRVGSERVRIRAYEPELEPGGKPWATLVWAHGGSFVRGTLDWPEADWVARQFADAGMRVYSVDYVLASDTVKAPAPANDVAAVLDWAAERAGTDSPLVIGGASAGAHLATLAALDRAERTGTAAERPVAALLLQYPTMHRAQRHDTALAAATAALPEQRQFDAARIAEMYAFYLGDSADLGDPAEFGDPADLGGPGDPGSGGAGDGQPAGSQGETSDPVFAVRPELAGELPPERLALLPPTVMVHADADDLRASGEQFAEQLRAAGVPVREAVQPGTVHGYMNRPDESVRARADAEETIDRFVAELRVVTADSSR